MTTTFSPRLLLLQPGQHWSGSLSADAVLKVSSGRAWVTHAGDPVDYFVSSGESHRIPAHCAVVIGAEGELRMALHRVPPSQSAIGQGERAVTDRGETRGWGGPMPVKPQEMPV